MKTSNVEIEEYFTVVFRGDIRKLGFNPLDEKTSFGEVVGVSIGDCLTELWDLRDKAAFEARS